MPGTMGDGLRKSMNRVAGTEGMDAQGAANVWAGTDGLSLVGALNVKAGPVVESVYVDHNLVPNPSFEVDDTDWETNPGTAPGAADVTVETSGGHGGDNFLRLEWTVVPTIEGGFASPDIFVRDKSQYRGFAYLRPSVDVDVIASWLFSDNTGGEADPVSCPNSVWTKVPVAFETPEGVDEVILFWDIDGAGIQNVGDTLDIDDAILVRSATEPDYFDGNDTDTDDPTPYGLKVVYAWDGTPDLSTSSKWVGKYGYGRGIRRVLNELAGTEGLDSAGAASQIT